LTFGVYAHIGVYDQTAALDVLPDLSTPTPGADAVASTGTDGRRISEGFSHYLPTDRDGSGRKLSLVGGDEHENARRTGRTEALENKESDASCRPLTDTAQKYTRQDSNLQPTVPKTVALSN
jgi:hypothetical protein